MKRRKTTENRIRKSVAAMAACLCLVLSSCSGSDAVGVKTISSVQARNVINVTEENSSALHYAESRDSYSETVVSSGFIELRVDRLTDSFAVYDTSAGVLWSSLPLSEDAGDSIDEDCSASLVTLRIAGGTDEYVLNSQDNSLAYGTSSVETNDSGAVFTYDIFSSRASAEKETYSKDDIGFEVALTVTLADGNMNVGCKWKNLTGNKDAYIENIEVLNYFGAYNDMGEENFLFVPDGCGAVIKTSVYDESFESLSFAVYGNDPSCDDETSGTAIMPVFGVKRGNGAVAAIIEGGDAVAEINAEKATDLTGYNRAWSSFTITPSAYTDETLSLSKTESISEIDLCYRFLSANNASYSGMASAVREQLIRDNVLSSRTVDTTDYLPFYVSLTGVTEKSIGKLKYKSVLTDFEEALDLVTRMKNKGINNISVVYSDVFSGSPGSGDASSGRIMSRVGGTSGLADLYDYISSRNMSLYFDIDVLSSEKGFSEESGNIHGSSTQYTKDNSEVSRSLRKTGDIKDVVSGILANTRNYDFTGFCLDDAGSLLYSDFSEGGALRQEAADLMGSKVTPLATSSSIMVDTGNFYMLKNAVSVVNLPLETTVAKSGAYIPVPFAQLVLHGMVDYSGEAINTTENSEILLKYIEYGACPHYQWNYTALDSGNPGSDEYYYDNTINSAAEFYSEINSALSDLRDARMTDHYEVEDGIFCTEYDNGAMIYVNYTGSDYSVLGVVVEAGSFLRLG